MNAESAVGEVFSLPIEPLQKKTETEYVIKAIRDFFAQ